MTVPPVAIDAVDSVQGLPPVAQTLIWLGVLALAAVTATFLVRHVLLRILSRAVEHFVSDAGQHVVRPTAGRLAYVVPAVVVADGIGLVPYLPAGVVTVVHNLCTAVIVLSVVMAISAALNIVNELYQRRPGAANRPIKGYLQVLKILIYCGAAILIVAALMERSPLLLLSGLGAMAAVLMLVFKDTILSLVASVQLTSNDMLRVGDWIEMPQLNANGDVIDIALHTVKVQNWDKTITTIPTHRLIAESYINWRGMQESGGRRIQRALMLDQCTVRFLEPEEQARLRRFALIDDYLERKQAEIDAWNARALENGRDRVNARRVTNLGTFRAYVQAYIEAHPKVSKTMTLMVRQLEPTPQGVPIEVYCFTTTTAWVEYEGIQGDIFDHLLAILPEFDLRLFQEPTGGDVRKLGDALAGAVRSPAS